MSIRLKNFGSCSKVFLVCRSHKENRLLSRAPWSSSPFRLAFEKISVRSYNLPILYADITPTPAASRSTFVVPSTSVLPQILALRASCVFLLLQQYQFVVTVQY